MAVLEIKDLHVTREGKEILKGVNLKTGPGEVQEQIPSEPARFATMHLPRIKKIDHFRQT